MVGGVNALVGVVDTVVVVLVGGLAVLVDGGPPAVVVAIVTGGSTAVDVVGCVLDVEELGCVVGVGVIRPAILLVAAGRLKVVD